MSSYYTEPSCQDDLFLFKNANGDPWGMHITRSRDNDTPLVRFFDRRYINGQWPYGQPLPAYYADTIAESKSWSLVFWNDIPDWKLDGDGYQTAKEHLIALGHAGISA